MILRKELERVLPLKNGEKHLSEKARKTVFRGPYIFSDGISDVRSSFNWRDDPNTARPYTMPVNRIISNGKQRVSGETFGGKAYKIPLVDVVAELRDPEVRQRASRIEKLAQTVKVALIGMTALTISVGSVLLSERDSVSHPSEPAGFIKECGEIANGREVFMPIQTDQMSAAQAAGQVVCNLAGHNYVVTTPLQLGN